LREIRQEDTDSSHIYHEMKRDYSELKEEFTEWYGLSQKERLSRGLPVDMTAFSKAHLISNQSLHNWRKQISDNGQSGDFDPKNYIDANLEKLLKKLIGVASGERGTAKHLELALKLAGLLVEKREETHKLEFTPSDRIRVATELRDDILAELRTTGVCPCCHQRQALYAGELDTGREQQQEDTVATLALPARPD